MGTTILLASGDLHRSYECFMASSPSLKYAQQLARALGRTLLTVGSGFGCPTVSLRRSWPPRLSRPRPARLSVRAGCCRVVALPLNRGLCGCPGIYSTYKSWTATKVWPLNLKSNKIVGRGKGDSTATTVAVSHWRHFLHFKSWTKLVWRFVRNLSAPVHD